MSKSRLKLISLILSCSMFLAGCEQEIQEIENTLREKLTFPNLWTISSIEESSTETTISTKTSETEFVITETEEFETEPVVEETTRETESPVEETISETEPPIDLTIDDIVVHATTKVNVRSGNTTDSLIIGSMELGDAAYKILSVDKNWDLVRTKDQIGFVHRDYLEYSEEKVEDEYEHEVKNDIVLTTTNLNLRQYPTVDSTKIGNFESNTELEVVAEVDNGWLLVKYNGQLGYVKCDYTKSLLEIAKEQYPELEIEDLGVQKVVYSNGNLNIRSGNSTEYDIIGELERFETVRVIGEYDDWYFVLTNDYNFGFISKEYTRDLEDTYVVVDKGEQQLYLYENNELLYTTPVTTGKDNTPTDTGLFNIYSKETDRYLTDGKTYNVHVDYWMPYNGGEGLHDASWRSTFGTENYHSGGSHGCVNIPQKITPKIYEKVNIGDTVIVHK